MQHENSSKPNSETNVASYISNDDTSLLIKKPVHIDFFSYGTVRRCPATGDFAIPRKAVPRTKTMRTRCVRGAELWGLSVAFIFFSSKFHFETKWLRMPLAGRNTTSTNSERNDEAPRRPIEYPGQAWFRPLAPAAANEDKADFLFPCLLQGRHVSGACLCAR